jgi:methylated-DNA-[protein]-cysteine S-methyltransferase
MDTPVGQIVLRSDHTHLKSVVFSDELVDEVKQIPDVLRQAVSQLGEYFKGTRTIFDLNLDPDGTLFQKKVWKLLMLVPFGSTKSYSELAIESGSVLNTRAVGTANGKNPISIIIPCHRIIGAKGKLVGYAGGLERKRFLLLHEANFSESKGVLFK